jgi:SAM-dependent methyltransferase
MKLLMFKDFKIKKISCLELILLLLFIVLVFVFLRPKREGFVDVQKEFVRKSGDDVFDDFYVDIYDDLVHSDIKNRFEVKEIIKNPDEQAMILDIGSGTGHHVNLFSQNNNQAIGIDISPAMIKIAKQNYPELDFRLANALDTMQFAPETFSHISCLYFTIYYIQNKRLFIENCFKWLKPGGVLVLHLVNMNTFDPILPIANPFVVVSPQSYTDNRITESKVDFNTLEYKSDFQLDQSVDPNSTILNEPNAIFKETIKFKDAKKTRINEHSMFMSSQKSILSLAREAGFILQSQKEMDRIQYENNYLYTLVKPN